MVIEGGLPLGMLAAAKYEGATYQLTASDRLTLISDGVVEARKTESELYGFARTQQISNRTAATIANAARTSGRRTTSLL